MSNNDSALTTKWSHRRFIVGLTALAVSLALQAQDFARLSEQTIIGTARYVGMSGAMSAIGGDPSAAHDNVAGLGLYRRPEVLVSVETFHERTRQNTDPTKNSTTIMVPQASVVFSLPTNNLSDEGILFHNFMFSYRRLHTYFRRWSAQGTNGPSLGALIEHADTNWDIDFCKDRMNATNAIGISESGAVNEFDLSWAMNISNRWFVGLGLTVQSYSLSSDAIFYETFDRKNGEGKTFSNQNTSSLLLTGVGVGASAGIIYRPVKWVRLGFGLRTPTVGKLSTYTSGNLRAQADTFGISYAGDFVYTDSKFHLPIHLSSSLAFQLGAYGLVAFQYDYIKHSQCDPLHSLRAGIEIVPVLGFYINAGYAYESSFNNVDKIISMDPTFERQDTYCVNPKAAQYISAALGYRGAHIIVQAAYQYRWQYVNLYAHENAEPYFMRADTHRVVLTLGWHKH